MKRALFFIILIAVLASFFASSSPDGLEKVAERLGFIEKAADRTSPLPDYAVPGMPEGGVSTATAGIAGVLITLSLFWLTAYLIKKGNNGMKKTLMFLFALSILLSSTTFAARPLVTDDYGTVDTDKYELETGFNVIKPTATGIYEGGFVVQLKKGITSNFDFGLELPYNIDQSGFSDAVLHAKLKLFEFSENEGVTVRCDVKVTNGDAVTGLGSGYLDYGGLMILSKKAGPTNVHLNAGYSVIGDPANSSSDDTFQYNAAVEYSVVEGLDTVIEYTGLSNQIETLANLQIGGRWQVSERARFDAGYSIAMNNNSNNIATVGLTSGF